MNLVESPTAFADAATDPTDGDSSPVDDETERRPCPLIAGYAQPRESGHRRLIGEVREALGDRGCEHLADQCGEPGNR